MSACTDEQRPSPSPSPVPVAVLSIEDRIQGSLLGLALGDAVGLTQEIFPTSENLEQIHARVLTQRQRRRVAGLQTDLEGGGPWVSLGTVLDPGDFTDDTSMALCLADSIIQSQGLNVHDLISKFLAWWDTGYNASRRVFANGHWVGRSCGLGGNISRAIGLYRRAIPAQRLAGTLDAYLSNPANALVGGTNPMADAGNGSLMRLAPVALYWHNDMDQAMAMARLQTQTTHNVPEATESAALLANVIVRALNGETKAQIFDHPTYIPTHPEIAEIARADAAWRTKREDEIRTLPGRALWTLEAAFWCIEHTDNFREAILTAANLGGDADTVGAVVGQIAGALYAESGIPAHWIQTLKHHDKIRARAVALFHRQPWVDDWLITGP